MMPTVIVLIGPHGAGKTTTGRLLAESLGVPFHDEVGRRLAENPTLRPQALTAADSQPAFDEVVIREELARDAHHHRQRRVVETWHPGNLAYATLRSGLPSAELMRAMHARCARTNAVVVPLMASKRTLGLRQNEPGDPRFFSIVGRSSVAWARRLGLRVLSPVSTDGRAVEQVAGEILRWLSPQQEVA